MKKRLIANNLSKTIKVKYLTFISFIIISMDLFSQTFHSNVQIDAEKAWTYSHGVSRENVTFTIDLIKLKFSITSSFLSLQNLELILVDARMENDENELFKKSKYELQNKGNSTGMFLYIEDHKNVKSELIVGKYNKGFALQLIEDGKQKLFLACYINELELSIKYNPKTVWCNYQQAYTSDYWITFYPLSGNPNGEIKRTHVIIEIDTINQYMCVNNQNGFKIDFIEEGRTEYLGSKWVYKKYKNGDLNTYTIFKTDSAVAVENNLYNRIFILSVLDYQTNEIIESHYIFSNTSTIQAKDNDDYLMEKPDGGE